MDDVSDPAAGPEVVEGGDDIGSSGEEEEEAPDVSPPPGDEDEEQKDPAGEDADDHGDEPNETEDEGPPSDDSAMAEEALEVIEEIANVEGETPEEVLDELEEEAEDLEYFEEAIDEMGDDLIAVEEEIAEEMGAEVDEIDVPEDLSGKGMIATDATAYDVPGTVTVSFEIDPFLPFDWVGMYPFDAAYHDRYSAGATPERRMVIFVWFSGLRWQRLRRGKRPGVRRSKTGKMEGIPPSR